MHVSCGAQIFGRRKVEWLAEFKQVALANEVDLGIGHDMCIKVNAIPQNQKGIPFIPSSLFSYSPSAFHLSPITIASLPSGVGFRLPEPFSVPMFQFLG